MGVKLFFIVGFLLAVAFVYLGWRFVSQRYGEKPPPPAPAKPVAAVPTAKPAEAPQAIGPTPSPVPLIPLLDEFVARLKVSGVMGGARPRAMIDGVLVRPGQMVEPTSGISLETIDTEKRLLHFKDKEGRTAKLKY